MTSISIIALVMVAVGYVGAKYTELVWSTGHEHPSTVTWAELGFTIAFLGGGVLACISVVLWFCGGES